MGNNYSIFNERLSLLQWESITAVIANSINNLLLALESITSFENMDLKTPNRLRMDRNNERSPIGEMVVCDNPTKLLKENANVYNAWFKAWLLNHVPKLVKQDKRFKGNDNLQVGDFIMFLKDDSKISKTYKYGMIDEVH